MRSCSPVGVKNQNGVDVQAISNLAIGFPVFWNYSISVRVGLGASLLLITGCRCTIPRDRGLVAGAGYTTFFNTELHLFAEVFCSPLLTASDSTAASSVIDADDCATLRQALGARCHVTCRPGFQLEHVVDSYTCRYDGRTFWDPTTAPVCIGTSWCMACRIGRSFGITIIIHHHFLSL